MRIRNTFFFSSRGRLSSCYPILLRVQMGWQNLYVEAVTDILWGGNQDSVAMGSHSRSTLWCTWPFLCSSVTPSANSSWKALRMCSVHIKGTTDQLLLEQRFLIDIEIRVKIFATFWSRSHTKVNFKFERNAVRRSDSMTYIISITYIFCLLLKRFLNF